jgi:hypothetical protein
MQLFIHPYEDAALNEVQALLPFQNQLEFNYREYVLPSIEPDLLGKTVRVTERQFSDLYRLALNIAQYLEIDMPPIYIFENFYFSVEAKGLDNYWIEISSKTLSELSKEEITFLLAKEMCAIKLGYIKYHTLIEQSLNFIRSGIKSEVVETAGKYKMYRWLRITHFTSDQMAYLMVGDMQACMNAILKTVLNDVFLADNVHISTFIAQSEQINSLNSSAHNCSKMDEQVPYAPFRLKNLISYAASSRGITAAKLINNERTKVTQW